MIFIFKFYSHSSSYSIGVRLKSEIELKDKAIPGAGKYNSRYAYKKLYDSLPQFTLRPRTPIYMPSKGIPAPNKYFPGPNPKQRFAPKYSMKPRLEVGSPMYSLSSNRRGPGPGAYNIKSCIAVQQYKIKFKSRHDLRDRSISPACNHYKPDRGSRPHSAHSYSMLFRRQVKNLAYESPGPIYNTLRPLGYRKPF